MVYLNDLEILDIKQINDDIICFANEKDIDAFTMNDRVFIHWINGTLWIQSVEQLAELLDS